MPQAKTKKPVVAVLGYGSQGRAIALNLRDSGYPVIIGAKTGSAPAKKARNDRFRRVSTVRKAVSAAEIVCLALPDHLHQRIWEKDIKKQLRPGSTLLFLHGFSVHFGFIDAPDDCDVILVAPHGPGVAVREKYLTDRSMSAFYAVHQNHSKKAPKVAVRMASALGFKKDRLVKTTFEQEAIGDLFGEQAVLCGGLSELILHGFEVLVEKGLPPENAYLEVAYQLDLIIELIKKHGIRGMYDRISVTARYGSVKSGSKIVGRSVKSRMKKLYGEIESGKFARALNRLTPGDIAELRRKIGQRVPASFENSAKKHSR